MKKETKDEVFNKFLHYHVFIRTVQGGGKMVILVEAEAKGVTDMIYHYSADTEKKKVYFYEISSPGVVNNYWANRAELGNMGYAGMINGYGANAYLKYGGDLKAFIEEYGTLGKKPGLFSKLFGWIFK